MTAWGWILAQTVAFAGSGYQEIGVSAGFGQHHGGAGVNVTWRTRGVGLGAGFGVWGVAGEVKLYPARRFRPWFLTLGYAPIWKADVWEGFETYYGPNLMTGIEVQRGPVLFRVNAGFGIRRDINDLYMFQPTWDVAVGVNLGRLRGVDP